MKLFDWLYRLMRWFIGGLFVYAGLQKLAAPTAFGVLIEAFGIVPEGLVQPAAVGLAILETVIGVGLLFDVQGSLAAVAGLLGFFVAILGYGLWLGLDVDCGCFGPQAPEAEAFHGLEAAFWRDLSLLAGVAWGLVWRRRCVAAPVEKAFGKNRLRRKGRSRDAND